MAKKNMGGSAKQPRPRQGTIRSVAVKQAQTNNAGRGNLPAQFRHVPRTVKVPAGGRGGPEA